MVELDIGDLLDAKAKELGLVASFHDATLLRINLDYRKREAILDWELIDVWKDDACDVTKDDSIEKQGRLTFTGLQYFVIEPPDGNNTFEDTDGLTVPGDGTVANTEFRQPITKLPETDDNVFVN